jgi:hypothetical protein
MVTITELGALYPGSRRNVTVQIPILVGIGLRIMIKHPMKPSGNFVCIAEST